MTTQTMLHSTAQPTPQPAPPLPFEYIPLCLDNAVPGTTIGDIRFALRPASHEKTVAALIGSVERKPVAEDPYPDLLPSERWAWARVMCTEFGRLNEVALARSRWEIYAPAMAGEPLYARSTIVESVRKGALAFCNGITETRNAEGTLLIRCHDGIILTHDCEKPFFFEPEPVKAEIPDALAYRNIHTVYHRYPWKPTDWDNNIHVDEYAQSCGFKSGLPEFITYMDWIYHAVSESGWRDGRPYSIQLNRVLPIYLGEKIEVVAWPAGSGLQVRFLSDGFERVTATVDRLG